MISLSLLTTDLSNIAYTWDSFTLTTLKASNQCHKVYVVFDWSKNTFWDTLIRLKSSDLDFSFFLSNIYANPDKQDVALSFLRLSRNVPVITHCEASDHQSQSPVLWPRIISHSSVQFKICITQGIPERCLIRMLRHRKASRIII